MTQIATFRSTERRVVFNKPLIAGIFFLIILLDILNNETRVALSLPLEFRSLVVFLLAFINLGVIIVDTKKGLFLFIFLLISQNSLPLFSLSGFTSIYATEIVPYIDLVDMLFIALVSKLIIDTFIVGRLRFVDSRVHLYVLAMAIFVVLEGLWGLARYEDFNYFARDMQGFLYLFGLFGIISFLNLSKKDLENLVWLIIISLGAKAMLYVIKFILGIGRPYGAGLRTIFGGDPQLFFISFFALAPLLFYVLMYRNFDIRDYSIKWILIPAIVGFELFFWILNPSRGTWLVFSVLILLAFWHLSLSFHKKGLLFFTTLATAVIFIMFLSVTQIPTLQGIYKHLSWEASTLLQLELWTSFHEPGSFSVRTAEFINIYHKLLQNGTLLFGEGLGSWWSIHGYIDLTSVLGSLDDPAGGFSSVKPRGTHFPISEMFLKFGLIGSFIYWGLWMAILWELRRLFISTRNLYHRSLIFGFVIASLGLLAGGFLQYKIFLGINLALVPKLYFYAQEEPM